MKEDDRAVLTTDCESEIGNIGPIHPHTPLPAPDMDCGNMILDGLGSGFRVRIILERKHVSSAKVGRSVSGWVGISAAYTL